MEEEAKVLKSLSHPNIIGFRGFNKKEDGTHSLVMEDGHKSLLDIIDERSEQEEEPFSVPVIESVIEKVASALNYLHTEKQILHGDIKSGNVLVVADFQNVKLCDFGVTLPLNEDGVVSDPDRKYVGTEAWSPMEVIKDDAAITSKADIFAFGLLIYEMLALHSPHVDKLVIDDEDDDPFSNVPPKAANTQHSDPDSYAWSIIRLAALNLAQKNVETFLLTAGIELPELPLASPFIYKCLRTSDIAKSCRH